MKTPLHRTAEPTSPRPKPEPNACPAVVEAGCVYSLEELARRLRWRKHSLRQARRLGFKVVKFGSRNYVLGRHVLEFFEKLGQQQADLEKGR